MGKFLLIMVLFFQFVFSWGFQGHKLVGRIAYDNLTSHSKKIVDQWLVEIKQQYGPDFGTLKETAIIMDTLRSYSFGVMNSFHFVPVPYNPQNIALPPIAKVTLKIPNVVSVLGECVGNMSKLDIPKHSGFRANEKALDLTHSMCFVMMSHLMGDIMAPQHNISRYNAQFPNGDKGGNSIKVKFQGEDVSLHHIWDIVFDSYEDIDFSDDEKIDAITKQLTETYLFQKSEIDNMHFTSWHDDNYKDAVKYFYDNDKIKDGDILSEEYIKNGKFIANRNITLAGYRLAYALNTLLKDYKEPSLFSRIFSFLF